MLTLTDDVMHAIRLYIQDSRGGLYCITYCGFSPHRRHELRCADGAAQQVALSSHEPVESRTSKLRTHAIIEPLQRGCKGHGLAAGAVMAAVLVLA